ncbi:hypothetical protein [Niabella drilacis]|uniref:Uncharacterized protein n=1 Tax=Niabella drilacis (strain DSM 25811 / CCM 8410 / CCUG 62505 / LMG 26954 / E90) TaxID=1285928 RepID=A0A1G6XHQ4_NIADE|nr:hypothetical protein [Niabella drilacis]SDD77700.1 hypothetical protein SAMN04487894_11381 [Niabella drilacis]
MQKTSTRKQKQHKPKPELKWQTGAYERFADFNFILPYQFLLLCRLMDVTPREALTDFMDNLSCGSWNRKGRDSAKEHLINYFIAHGYGQEHYTEANIRQIFKEMDAVGLLFPRESNGKMVDRYAKWRDKHQNWWFKKWYRKPRHTPLKKEAQ